MNVNVGIQGEVNLKVFDINENLISETKGDNAISVIGAAELLNCLGVFSHENKNVLRRIAFGTDGTPDDYLFGRQVQNPVYADLPEYFGGSSISNPGVEHFAAIDIPFGLGFDQGNGVSIRELALILSQYAYPEGNTQPIFARIVRAPIAKTNQIRIEGVWTIKIYTKRVQ